MTALLPMLLVALACSPPDAAKTDDAPLPGADSATTADDSTPASTDDSTADSDPASLDDSATDDSGEPVDTGEPVQPDPVVRFIAMGDGGEGNADQYTNAEAVATVCAARGCDFVLYLGDNIYDDGAYSVDDPQFEEKFEAPYANLTLPFWVVLGNHDYGEIPIWSWKADYEVEYSDYSEKWNMPDRYYTFTQEHVQFFGLDTSDVFLWGGGDQQPWFDSALAASTSDWRIAFGHHPYISNGRHGNAGEYEGFEWLPIANGEAVKEFMDESLCGQVDLYFSGHDHNRQWLVERCSGTEFIVSGAAAKTTDLEGRGNQVYFEDDTIEGFFWIEIVGDELTGVIYNKEGTEEYSRSFTREAR